MIAGSEHTGGFATPAGMTTAAGPFTPPTGLPPHEEPCREGPSLIDPREYKRDRSGSKKRENKTRNRKAAKAARKARKK